MNELLLLELINYNASFSILRKRGLTNSQIALLIQNCIKKGYIIVSDDRIIITDRGSRLLIASRGKRGGKCILPAKSSTLSPIDNDIILLPKRL